MTMHQWKTALITLRIHELNSVKFTLPGHSYCNYGAPTPMLNSSPIKCAITISNSTAFVGRELVEHAEHAQSQA